MKDVIAFVLAGGEGRRLYPLTAYQPKPAAAFGLGRRIIDFVLSNLVNSGISAIFVLVQYRPQSLIRHIQKVWRCSSMSAPQRVQVVPPPSEEQGKRYLGTADAVRQNAKLISEHRPELVGVFSSDHVYRMDVDAMVRFHQECEAEISVAAVPVAIEEGGSFGVLAAHADGRVYQFQEKPEHPTPIASDSSHAYASMGNYLFNAEILTEILEQSGRNGETDFGHHVFPRLVQRYRVFAYDFASNSVPGVKAYEDSVYWRDVGTIGSYWSVHQDILGAEPKFDMDNPSWPVRPTVCRSSLTEVANARIHNSLVSREAMINGAVVSNSTIHGAVCLERGVRVEDSIIMGNVLVKKGSSLRRVIVDQYNVIDEATYIGWDTAVDRRNYYVDSSGIVVVRRGGLEEYRMVAEQCTRYAR